MHYGKTFPVSNFLSSVTSRHCRGNANGEDILSPREVPIKFGPIHNVLHGGISKIAH